MDTKKYVKQYKIRCKWGCNIISKFGCKTRLLGLKLDANLDAELDTSFYVKHGVKLGARLDEKLGAK